jgi:spermidine synthase
VAFLFLVASWRSERTLTAIDSNLRSDGPSHDPETTARLTRGAGPLAFGLFFASGIAGLVYQVIWLRQLTLIFGATAYASSAVLSTFMGGLALGSYWAGRHADRWTTSPLRAYGALELGVTGYAAAIPWLLKLSTPLLHLVWNLGGDRHFAALGLVKFVAIAILILPATTLMGATLPVLSRLAADRPGRVGASVGTLYAVNTLGAVVGTITAAFIALPALGMRRTLLANLALNGLVALIAWTAGRGSVGIDPRPPSADGSDGPPTVVSNTLVWAFAASGFGAMVLEVAWTRGMALVLGSSVYAYASMLTAFLLGLASGAGAASRYLKRERRVEPRVAWIALAVAGVLSFAAAYAIQALPRVFAEVYFRLSPSPEGWWVVQVGIALFVMFPTTFALGWVFPLVLDAAGGGRRTIAASVGRIYAANTVGTIVGAVCGGFVLIPVLGVGATLVGVAAGQLVLAALVMVPWEARTLWTRGLAVACVALSLLVVAVRPAWDVLMMNSGVYMNIQNVERSEGWAAFRKQVVTNNDLVYAKDGLTASVLVARQPASDNTYLAVNGKTDASSRVDLETQIVIGHFPLLFHPDARDVLIIGLASGITIGSAATHPLEHIRVVEVEAAMVGAARAFAPFNHDILNDPRVTLSINDARNELQFNPADYDVIISEPSNPWMTVASNLFTYEFFRIGRSRLRPGGVFGQWIQTYSLAPDDLKSILAGFSRVFPHVLVFEAANGVDLLALGSDRPWPWTSRARARSSGIWVRADLARAGVLSALDVAARLQTGGEAVSSIVRGATVNTDDNGQVEFRAPKALYLDTQDANMALLRGVQEDPMAVVSSVVRSPDPPDVLRLEMVRRWLRRDQRSRASQAAEFFQDPVSKSQAESYLHAGL